MVEIFFGFCFPAEKWKCWYIDVSRDQHRWKSALTVNLKGSHSFWLSVSKWAVSVGPGARLSSQVQLGEEYDKGWAWGTGVSRRSEWGRVAAEGLRGNHPKGSIRQSSLWGATLSGSGVGKRAVGLLRVEQAQLIRHRALSLIWTSDKQLIILSVRVSHTIYGMCFYKNYFVVYLKFEFNWISCIFIY